MPRTHCPNRQPSPPGEEITRYAETANVRHDTGGDHATTCTLTGLTNGREYVVSVVATNVAGSSAPATTTVTARQGQHRHHRHARPQ